MGNIFKTEAEKKRESRNKKVINLYQSLRKEADDSGEEISDFRIFRVVASKTGMTAMNVSYILKGANIIETRDEIGRPKSSC